MARVWGEPVSWLLGLVASTFALAKIDSILDPNFYRSPYLAAILVAFVGHELAHRGVARMYGAYAEFIATPLGLALTFASGFLPNLVILTPGYVRVVAPTWRPGWMKALTYSVAAGPLSNLLMGFASLSVLSIASLSGWLGSFLSAMAKVNAWIAFFNLLPVPPLDGSKIVNYSKELWALMIGASFILLFI